MEQKQNRIAPEAATDEPASPVNLRDSYFSPPAGENEPPPREKVTVPPDANALPPLLTDFDPAPLRYREDGLTPQKQREFVEALADCGIARQAAARIGVSEQAIARVRRRADARAFDLACEAAQRIGARRIRSVAYERAIEGTVRRHYYHGELKSEEVVFDNRLLIYLLGKTAHLVDPPAEAQAVAENWEGWMEAIEQGLAAPEPVDAGAEPDSGEAPEACGDEERRLIDHISMWQEDGRWWTDFPPPAGFDGLESGAFGDRDYCRTLGEMEQEVADEWDADEHAERLAAGMADRDRFFGFVGGSRDDEEAEDETGRGGGILSPREAETYETSVHPERGRRVRPEPARCGDGEEG